MSPSTFLLSLALLSVPSLALAQEAPSPARAEPKAYAIIIGNNAAGPGQDTLHYAEADAKRVSSVLSELGGYHFQEPRLLLSPSPLQLWDSFDAVQREIRADQEQGVEAVLFFYYSGHARSTALDLGASEVELSDLRARIEAMPASLRVVVLDACQSGAISRVKGAKATADFSTSSVASLSMTGLAIMASSTGTELSQESDALEGSYFTHHLVSGLRGAADKDGDGAVTLSEAYAYAYDSTLLATAVSAVGKQHVTLETDLRGKGDVAITRPAEADAKLVLPADLVGAVTISKRGSVMAEVNKVAGQAVSLALPTGAYSVIVRKDASSARECEASLRSKEITSLSWGTCRVVHIAAAVEKGGGPGAIYLPAAEPFFVPQWHVELNLGLRGSSNDAYTDRLQTFGYERDDALLVHGHYNLKAYRSVAPYLQFGVSAGLLESDSFRRHTDGASTYDLNWSTYHASALGRLYQSLGDDESMQVFAEGSLGLSWSSSRLLEETMNRSDTQLDIGYALSGSLGLSEELYHGVGVVLTAGYSYAPTLDNELQESHNGAGLLYSLGLVGRF